MLFIYTKMVELLFVKTFGQLKLVRARAINAISISIKKVVLFTISAPVMLTIIAIIMVKTSAWFVVIFISMSNLLIIYMSTNSKVCYTYLQNAKK